MTKNKRISVLIIVILLFIIVTGCSNDLTNIKNEPIKKTQFIFGTIIDITIYDNASDKVFDKAFERLKEIENKMTINREDSQIIDINSKAGKDSVKVSDDTFYVIKRGKYFSELSGGRFDISIGPLVKLWNIGTDYARIPSQEEIDINKDLVNYNNVILNESEKSVMLKKEGMILDLGGIAKGYGADEIARILKENNVEHAIINLGGNIFTHGNKPDGNMWKVGVQNPFSPRGDYIGIVNVANQTVVTSGIYERFFIEKESGKRYHHILDSDTGYPVENNLAGVSIIANSSIDADSLSTSVFSLGLDEGMKVIEDLEYAEAVFITKNSEVFVTSGLAENFTLTDSSFELMKELE